MFISFFLFSCSLGKPVVGWYEGRGGIAWISLVFCYSLIGIISWYALHFLLSFLHILAVYFARASERVPGFFFLCRPLSFILVPPNSLHIWNVFLQEDRDPWRREWGLGGETGFLYSFGGVFLILVFLVCFPLPLISFLASQRKSDEICTFLYVSNQYLSLLMNVLTAWGRKSKEGLREPEALMHLNLRFAHGWYLSPSAGYL